MLRQLCFGTVAPKFSRTARPVVLRRHVRGIHVEADVLSELVNRGLVSQVSR
jgi:hypothetical protein